MGEAKSELTPEARMALKEMTEAINRMDQKMRAIGTYYGVPIIEDESVPASSPGIYVNIPDDAPWFDPESWMDPAEDDPVENPSHYNNHPSGIECIEITKHMNFPLGNAIKYIWRVDEKGDPIENLRKAIRYIEVEIERRQEIG